MQLAPGDRVILHSDGAEDVFRHQGSGRDGLIATLQKLRELPVDKMAFQLAAVIDGMSGSLHPEDDITVVCMQVGEAAK